MIFTIEDPTTLDPAALSAELITAFGTNYGISTAGNIITTNGGEPDPVAFQAVLDAHVTNKAHRDKLAYSSPLGEIATKVVVRSKAKKLVKQGKGYEALALLKTIGE